MCEVLGIPRSTYYYSKSKTPSKREQENNLLKLEIQSIYDESKGIYGAPKIYKVLDSRGFTLSLKRIQRLMNSMGLRSIVVKKFRPYSTKNSIEERENVLNRDFSATNINEKWVGDITYIHTIKDGWCYLASVMDLYSKKIVGYSFGKSMTTDLVIDALNNAYNTQMPDEGLVFHSDLGSQYTGTEFSKYVKELKIIQSFSKKGCPYDNACIESFHAVLKKEEVHRVKYFDFESARLALFEYIEGWYNRKRIHSSIGYITPEECEKLARAI